MNYPNLSYREWLAISTAFLALAMDVGDFGAAAEHDARELAVQALGELNPLERRALLDKMAAATRDALDDQQRTAARALQRDLFRAQVDRMIQAELGL